MKSGKQFKRQNDAFQIFCETYKMENSTPKIQIATQALTRILLHMNIKAYLYMFVFKNV